MKTLCMKISAVRVLFICLLFLFIPFTTQAQNISDILFGDESNLDYIGQYNYNGKRRNGFGIERQKNGALYVGNFSEDNISGRGVLISETKGISNVPGAVVYVGGWYNGKKSGKGTCYDADGTLIYRGRFEKDKPVEESMETSEGTIRRFAMVNRGEDLYIGEINGNIPDGFGLTVNVDGSIIYCNSRDGERQGIGMIVYSPEIWDVGKWTDGTFKSIENSRTAENDLAAFRIRKKEANKGKRALLFEAASNFAQAGLAVAEMGNGTKNGDAPAGTSGATNASSYPSGEAVSSEGGSSSETGRQTTTCPLCKGSGRSAHREYAFQAASKPKVWCDICGSKELQHVHNKLCPRCNGKGYITK